MVLVEQFGGICGSVVLVGEFLGTLVAFHLGLSFSFVEVYFIQVFLLRRQEPLETLCELLGEECCKLLLELQVVSCILA